MRYIQCRLNYELRAPRGSGQRGSCKCRIIEFRCAQARKHRRTKTKEHQMGDEGITDDEGGDCMSFVERVECRKRAKLLEIVKSA